ncbi:MAG: phosphopyruvate hydratase [Hydrogenoanaerobacterium sp.]
MNYPFCISAVHGREILDSRGNPTVEAQVRLSGGARGVASVPSGASTGVHEALELRDGDKKRYGGKGVLRAVNNINGKISKAVCGLDGASQALVDNTLLRLDGTENKERLGANAILAVSLAVAKASANAMNLPLYRYLGGAGARTLPVPMMNILNGGAHASNNIDVQEFMIMPVGAASFTEGLRWCSEIYHTLGKILKAKGHNISVGDEGGFAPNLAGDSEALDFIVQAVEEAGYNTKSQIKIALDAAAGEWQHEGVYTLPKANTVMSTEALISHWENICEEYPVISIEDGVGEDDWEGWVKLTERLGRGIQLVGDDLFVTSTSRIKQGIELSAANSVLIKLNQIGTLSETLAAIEAAKNAGYRTIVSHRSGETEDSFIADLAVAVCAGQIKTGAPCRSDRVAKYNRLLRIEEHLQDTALYAGENF